jgi:hypothetical protein
MPYDARPALRRIDSGDESAWTVLWEELHHQGDVDLASYAAVPHIVRIQQTRQFTDYNPYALIGIIELCRGVGKNPPLPELAGRRILACMDGSAFPCVPRLRQTDNETAVIAILGALALAKKQRVVGEVLLDYTQDELPEMVRMYRN